MENEVRRPVEGDLRNPTGLISILDAATGERRRMIRAPGLVSSYDPAISPDGKLLAVVLQDGTVSLIELKTSRSVRRLDGGYEGGQVRLAFSPDGKLLATGGKPKVDQGPNPAAAGRGPSVAPIHIWDVATGRMILQLPGHPIRPHSQGISGLSFSPDGGTLASSCDESFVRLWDLKRGVQTFPGPDDSGPTPQMVFSPDSKVLITGGSDGFLRRWDSQSGAQGWRIRAHDVLVAGLAVSADGATVISQGENGTAKFWDATTGQSVRSMEIPFEKMVNYFPWDGGISTLDAAPNGQALLTGSPPHRLVDLATGVERAELRIGEQPENIPPMSAKFVPGGRIILAAHGTSVIEFDAGNGRPMRRFEMKQILPGVQLISQSLLAVAPDGKRFAVWGKDVHLLSMSDGREVIRLVVPKPAQADGKGTPSPGIAGVAFSPDGRLVAACEVERDRSTEGTRIWLWDAVSGAVVARIEDAHRRNISALLFSPDGSMLASSSTKDATTLIWDVATLRKSLQQAASPEQNAGD